MPAPFVTTDDFEIFTGFTLSDAEFDRVEVMLERASRHLYSEVDFPDSPSNDDTALWVDGVCELAWLYWEAEKSNVMEILSMPVSQLSLGTLFWTKETAPNLNGLWALKRLLGRFGTAKRLRFVLEDELEYPR